MKWVEQHIEITPPKRPKKLTATRFASVLGLNPWSTPFEIWCACTRTWEKPFEDTIYTAAGKAIEPKQIAYMRDSYLMDNLRTPTDVYGPGYFQKTFGDFFHEEAVLGGMWDSLLVDEDERPEGVLEFKTTKRSEDWENDIPEYYALQAALYADLLGVDDVIMVCSFLADKDYENPEAFVPTSENTITREFKVSERYPDFQQKKDAALAWWAEHVESGVSPDFDEKKDAEILKALRTNTVDTNTQDLQALLAEAEALKAELDKAAEDMAEKEKRYKVLTDHFKEIAKEQFKPGDKDVVIPGSRFIWTMTRSETKKLDEKRLKADGLYDQYAVASTSYRMTVKEKKEEDKA